MLRPFSIRRKEMQASRRMAWRLALLLGLVIAGAFVYWRIELHRALVASRADQTIAEACGDLEETEDLVAENEPSAEGVDEAALSQRLKECEEQGF